MSEPERPDDEPDVPPKRRGPPNIADAMGLPLPSDGHGLGSLGVELVHRHLGHEEEGDPEDRRDFYKFTKPWRDFIRKMSPAHLNAVYDRASADLEHQIIVKWRWRIAKWVSGAVGGSFVAAHWFSDQVAWISERAGVLHEAVQWVLRSWR